MHMYFVRNDEIKMFNQSLMRVPDLKHLTITPLDRPQFPLLFCFLGSQQKHQVPSSVSIIHGIVF